MKVKSYVHVRGEGGKFAVLAPGDTVPDWATVTNPDVIDGEPEAPKAEEKPAEKTEEKAAEPAPKPAPAPRKTTSRKAADS